MIDTAIKGPALRLVDVHLTHNVRSLFSPRGCSTKSTELCDVSERPWRPRPHKVVIPVTSSLTPQQMAYQAAPTRLQPYGPPEP